jgi:hypothetical protein
MINDESGPKSSHHFDTCMIFPVDPRTGAFSNQSEEVVKKIIPALGIHNVHLYYSVDRGEIIMLMRISEDRCQFYADLKDFHFLADEEKLAERAKLGWPEDPINKRPRIAPLKIDAVDRPDITRYRPFELIYLKYELEEEYQELYTKHSRTKSVFSHMTRLKLLERMLTEPADLHGLDLKIGILTKKPTDGSLPIVLAVYPLHHNETLAELKELIFSWKHLLPWDHPFNKIKDYFGEKITLYYKFVGMQPVLSFFFPLHFFIIILYTCRSFQSMVNFTSYCGSWI